MFAVIYVSSELSRSPNMADIWKFYKLLFAKDKKDYQENKLFNSPVKTLWMLWKQLQCHSNMRMPRSSILISWECRLQVVDNDTLLKSHYVTLHITLICAHSCYANDLLKYVLKLGIIPPYVCSLVLQTVATLELLLLNITNITETLEAPGCNVIGK